VVWARRLWDEVDEHIAWIARTMKCHGFGPAGIGNNLQIFPYYISTSFAIR
jgi:hypothetical protein